MFYPFRVKQLSFFSAEATGPRLADLSGVLCAQGQLVSFGRTAARLSVVVEEQWRAQVLAAEFRRRGADAQLASSEGGHPLVRTAFRVDLISLATAWNRGAVKAVPAGFRLDGAKLRMWALAAGTPVERGYLLALDPRDPDSHTRLVAALGALGLPCPVVGPGAGGPALRVRGRRRLETLAELIGEPPPGAEAAWPVHVPARQAG
jgi:hypothetical protein